LTIPPSAAVSKSPINQVFMGDFPIAKHNIYVMIIPIKQTRSGAA
jgi:hypothetical protein